MRALLPLFLAGLLAGCDSNSSPDTGNSGSTPGNPVCASEDPAATIDVTGTYRFFGLSSPYLMRGTITFEQTGSTVRVTGMTYENSHDRTLEGEGTLAGNRLDILLVPTNGDTDYEADITFLFGDDGDTFCVSFSDTNLDTGPMGSYRGERQ